MTFEELLKLACFSQNVVEKEKAAKAMEKYYCCELHCNNIDESVIFAHNGRGCTIVAAKLSAGVVIYQNVTIGSNMRYNKVTATWENIGSPILARNVVVSDGAKILGPITIGENTLVAAGAIITKDIPANSIAYGVNKCKPKDPNYELVFHLPMPSGDEIEAVNRERVSEFEKIP
ncbi:serine acetyltransferase [Pasteurellaceae bacterium Pebbles2]|nr:serine acetyltransferase [Pasteurellaceae bacterium Pebbles2]